MTPQSSTADDAVSILVRARTKRTHPRERLEDLLRAGATVFARRGYRRTQMADVAREMGVSPGNLYNYVEGKDALFYLVLRRALGERPDDQRIKLPVRGATVAVTAEWVAKRLDFVSDFPVMERALLAQPPLNVASEVELIVDELYEVLSRMRLGVEMIERSVEALPDLARVFGEVRRKLFARYERYLRQRMEAGLLRHSDPETVAHVIVDLCWWAAGRRPNDPHATAISETVARQTLRRFVTDALTTGTDPQASPASQAVPGGQ